MILKSVSIKNFRCYSSETTLHFLPPDKSAGKNIYLIGGRNGAGKTSLLGALHLCLYGRFESRDGSIRVSGPADMLEYIHGAYAFPNDRDALSQHARQSGNDTVQLSVSYSDETGSEIKIIRCWRPKQFRRTQPSRILEFQEDLTIHENGIPLTDWSRDEITQWIEETIPSGTAQFFFFDGEKVEHFADPDKTTQDLKHALERLLGIETYVNLRKHLQQYIVSPIRVESIDRLEGEMLTIQGQIKTLEGERQDLESELDQTDQALTTVREEKRSLTQQLEDFIRRNANIQASGRQREVGRRREQLNSQLKTIEDRKKTFLSDVFPYALLYEDIAQLLDESDALNRESAKSHGLEYIGRFVDHLLRISRDSGSCSACGAKGILSDGKTLGAAVEGFMRGIQGPKESRSNFILSSPIAEETARRLSHRLRSIREAGTTFADLERQSGLLKRQLDELEGELEELDVPPEAQKTHGRLLTQLRNNGAEEQRLSDKVDELRRQLELKQSQIEGLHEKLDHLEDDKQEKSKEQRVVRLARKAQAVLDDYVDTLRRQRLEELEKRATDVFQLLLSSAVYNETGGRISFEADSYKPIVSLEGSVKDARRISRGVQQLYALSLLAGLSQSARNTIPLVIDTPLSGLDDKNRECVLSRFFPVAAEQVILLCRPDEIGANDLDSLDGHVVQKSVLAFDPSLHSTYVHENQYF